jgi:hypothetical protein
VIHITLPALGPNGELMSRETLEVEAVQAHRYRLLHSPAFVEGIAGGDVIEVDPHVRGEYRVMSRAGNLAVLLALPDGEGAASPEVTALHQFVRECGGVFDGGPGRMHVFTIPLAAGFSRVEAAFNAAVAAVEGASWWYGNVYENGDERRPMSWWRTDQ